MDVAVMRPCAGAVGRTLLLYLKRGAPGTVQGSPMQRSTVGPVDVVEELRLRRWARENYVPAVERDGLWHPIILDEMFRKDRESHATRDPQRGPVPLIPAGVRFLHSAHLDTQRGELLLSVPEVRRPEGAAPPVS